MVTLTCAMTAGSHPDDSLGVIVNRAHVSREQDHLFTNIHNVCEGHSYYICIHMYVLK